MSSMLNHDERSVVQISAGAQQRQTRVNIMPYQGIMCRVSIKVRKRSWRIIDAMWPFGLALIAWEGLTWLDMVNAMLLPPPSTLLLTAITSVHTGVLYANTMGSLARVAVGFSLATLLGISSGVMLGIFPCLGQRVTPVLDVLRPIPPIAWIPIAILWFGIGNTSAVFIVAIGAFFPIFLNTYSGVYAVNEAQVNAAYCLGAGRFLIMTDILLPAILPQLLTGVRVGIGIAWTSVIAAEMVGVHTGLGYAIQLNRTMLETEAVIVNMMAIGVIGWMMNCLVSGLEQRLTRWNQGTLALQHTNERD
jgi:ABC-type nitrate/sulfonate/bicarbonate transport system permease component